MSDTAYLGAETLEPDGYLQPRRYRIRYQCERCGHEWTRTVTKLDRKDPPCPTKACKEAAIEEEVQRRTAHLERMLEEQKPPGHIGANVMVRAVDKTAEIVMEDHNLTNLKDGLREGDIAAPSLPGPMQRAADAFFRPGEALKGRVGVRTKAQAELLGRRALAGAFRDMAVNPAVVTPGTPGSPAIRSVGKQPI